MEEGLWVTFLGFVGLAGAETPSPTNQPHLIHSEHPLKGHAGWTVPPTYPDRGHLPS